MLISEFDYELPPELIAQTPPEDRQSSRMLCVGRRSGRLRDAAFSDLPEFLRAGDVVVVNNTKVFPARIIGRLTTGARIELFLIEEREAGIWEALARPGRRLKPGSVINFGEALSAEVREKSEDGKILVALTHSGDVYEVLEKIGRTPLPPYIKRTRGGPDRDRERYQTVYARNTGAIAAPTAGLHFTPEILEKLKDAGVGLVELTLHVGYGTFEPVRAENVAEHRVRPERFEIPDAAARSLGLATAEGRRVIAVGTTTVRALESAATADGMLVPGRGIASLTITPGYQFRLVSGLVTNFHLPRSSLLVLVSTFGGYRSIMDAYQHAVRARYRFYSYGDCMLIL